MASYIARRKVLATLLGGAAAAWPLAARTQQRERIRRIGALMAYTATDPEGQARFAAFVEGLQELGWANGRNVQIDSRWVGTDADYIRKHAVELARLTPDVILASATITLVPLQQATRTGSAEWAHRVACPRRRAAPPIRSNLSFRSPRAGLAALPDSSSSRSAVHRPNFRRG